MKRLSAIALLGGALVAPRAARAQALPVLRVATTPIELGAQVFYGKDEGFFKKAGLDVDARLMDGGAAIAAAVASGSLDIAQANLVSLATAHERGIPFIAIAPAGLYSEAAPTTNLVVAKSSTIKTGKDLENKTVAVNGLRNITQIGADGWVEQGGGDPDKVRFMEMPFPLMGAALQAGRIDAAVIAEPELSAVVASGGVRIIGAPYDSIGKQFLIGAWFTTREWAKAHPDAVKRFVASIIEAGRWANGHRTESASILEKYTKIHVGSGMRRTIFADRLDAALIQPLIDAAAKYKSIKKTFPASELFAAT